MKDQYTLIKGYLDLSQVEIDAMNAVKAEGERLRFMIEDLHCIGSGATYQRLVDIAETHLQQGIMAAVPSYFDRIRPTGYRMRQ